MSFGGVSGRRAANALYLKQIPTQLCKMHIGSRLRGMSALGVSREMSLSELMIARDRSKYLRFYTITEVNEFTVWTSYQRSIRLLHLHI